MAPKSGQPADRYQVLRLLLGPLETEVMEVLWAQGNCTVRDVVHRIRRPVAYTTVMTTLDRLFRKNLVGRRMYNRAYVYSALVTSEQWTNDVVKAVVEQLLAGSNASRKVIFVCMLEVLKHQPELLKLAEEKLLETSGNQLNRINDDATELGWWPT